MAGPESCWDLMPPWGQCCYTLPCCGRVLCSLLCQAPPHTVSGGCSSAQGGGCTSGGMVPSGSLAHAVVWWELGGAVILAIPWPACGGTLMLFPCYLFQAWRAACTAGSSRSMAQPRRDRFEGGSP